VGSWEQVLGNKCKKMAVFRRTLPPVLPGNVSETEEDFCSVDLDEGTDIGSNHSSPVEFGGKSEVEEDSESLGGDKKHSDQTTDQDH